MRGASSDGKTVLNRGLSLEQLAHELNPKLDSSMRTLTLAEQALSRHTASDISGLDDVASKLRRARAALCGIDDILAELDPLADKHGVDLDTWVSPGAALTALEAA